MNKHSGELRKQFENEKECDSYVWFEGCEHFTEEYVEWLEDELSAYNKLKAEVEQSPVFYVNGQLLADEQRYLSFPNIVKPLYVKVALLKREE